MTAAPALGSADGTAAHHGSRRAGTPVRRAVRVGLVAALVVALAALTLVLAYRPLDNVGGTVWVGQLRGDPAGFALGPPGRDRLNAFGSEIVVRPLPDGGRFGLIVDLDNRSPLPVTVLGVEPVLPGAYSRGTRLFTAVGRDDASSDLRPAHQLTVPAHGFRTVGFAVDVRGDCEPGDPGGTVTTDAVRLRYRFAGIPRTRTIRLHELAVSLSAPPRCDPNDLG